MPDEQVCRTCLKVLVSESRFINLDINDPTSSDIKSKLESCVPQMTIDTVKDPVICLSCVEVLNASFKFKLQCIKTEEAIYDYLFDCDNNTVDLRQMLKDKFRCKIIPKHEVKEEDWRLTADCDIQVLDVTRKGTDITVKTVSSPHEIPCTPVVSCPSKTSAAFDISDIPHVSIQLSRCDEENSQSKPPLVASRKKKRRRKTGQYKPPKKSCLVTGERHLFNYTCRICKIEIGNGLQKHLSKHRKQTVIYKYHAIVGKKYRKVDILLEDDPTKNRFQCAVCDECRASVFNILSHMKRTHD